MSAFDVLDDLDFGMFTPEGARELRELVLSTVTEEGPYAWGGNVLDGMEAIAERHPEAQGPDVRKDVHDYLVMALEDAEGFLYRMLVEPVADDRLVMDVKWQQTAAERFSTDVNARAEAALRSLGLYVGQGWGGCAGGQPDDALCADHAVEVKGTPDQLSRVARALRDVLAHPETLTISETSP